MFLILLLTELNQPQSLGPLTQTESVNKTGSGSRLEMLFFLKRCSRRRVSPSREQDVHAPRLSQHWSSLDEARSVFQQTQAHQQQGQHQ